MALFISLGGIVFFAIIIGFVVDAIQEKMESLKKGRSNVVESGHTVMLGWTPFSVAFILELCDANSSDGGGTIVVLAEKEKEDLEIEFFMQVKRKQLLGSNIVFRSGNPMTSSDLLKVSCPAASSILCLAPGYDNEGNSIDADIADAMTLRSVLALRGLEHTHHLAGHIVAEIRDKDNENLVEMVGADKVETIVSHDVIGRLMLMSARQPGLAKVFTEVLGFDGDEFYMQAWPQCVGKKFGDLAPHFKDAVVIGVKHFCNDKDCKLKCTHNGIASKGHIILNPAPNFVVPARDEIIVIAEDDDTYKYAEADEIQPKPLPAWSATPNTVEYILMTGWRRDIRDILKLLDALVENGTEVHMLASVPLADRTEVLLQEGLDVNTLVNITLVHHEGNSSSRADLEELPMVKFTSVMVLADEAHEHDIMHSDSHNLSTLLLLRDVQSMLLAENMVPASSYDNLSDKVKKTKIKKLPPCITEILDSRTQQTISTGSTVFAGSDFVQSNEMISQMLAMISEDPGVKAILSELLGSNGSDLCLETCDQYCQPTESITFLELANRGTQKHHVICGYANKVTGETVVNPRDKLTLRCWGEDTILVALVPPTGVSAENVDGGGQNTAPAVHAVSNFERLGGMETRVDRMTSRMSEIKQLIKDKCAGIETTSAFQGPRKSLTGSQEEKRL